MILKTAITGLLTISDSGKLLCINKKSTLVVSQPNRNKYNPYGWSLNDVQMPMPFDELYKILGEYDKQNHCFDIAFTEDKEGHKYQGKAFIHTMSNDCNVRLQGSNPLHVS